MHSFTDPSDRRDRPSHGMKESPVTRPEFAPVLLGESEIVAIVSGRLSKLTRQGHGSRGKPWFFVELDAERQDNVEGSLSRGEVELPSEGPPVERVGHLGHQETGCDKVDTGLGPLGRPGEGLLGVFLRGLAHMTAMLASTTTAAFIVECATFWSPESAWQSS